MSVVKEISESLVQRLRKSTFDTVGACKDVMKNKLEEQSLKAASTIILDLEAADIVNQISKATGVSKNQIASNIIKEYSYAISANPCQSKNSELEDKELCANILGSYDFKDEAVVDTESDSFEVVSEDCGEDCGEDFEVETPILDEVKEVGYENSSRVINNELTEDEILKIVIDRIRDEKSYLEIMDELNLNEEYFSEILHSISNMSSSEFNEVEKQVQERENIQSDVQSSEILNTDVVPSVDSESFEVVDEKSEEVIPLETPNLYEIKEDAPELPSNVISKLLTRDEVLRIVIDNIRNEKPYSEIINELNLEENYFSEILHSISNMSSSELDEVAKHCKYNSGRYYGLTRQEIEQRLMGGILREYLRGFEKDDIKYNLCYEDEDGYKTFDEVYKEVFDLPEITKNLLLIEYKNCY